MSHRQGADGDIMLRVNVDSQKIGVFQFGELIWGAPVSTSGLGLGEVEGSFKTPRGRHVIAEKIGEGAAWGTIFKSRKPVGLWSPGQKVDDDLVLTRILWLEGVEEFNRNSKARYIYFHGTNHEDKIGTPDSHGCIRLKNDDIIRLFDMVPVGAVVEIG